MSCVGRDLCWVWCRVDWVGDLCVGVLFIELIIIDYWIWKNWVSLKCNSSFVVRVFLWVVVLGVGCI